MKVSTYNLLQFVIHAYDDHLIQQNPNWADWFKSISRIYKHDIPKNVIMALKAKQNEQLDKLCDAALCQSQLREIKAGQREATALEKYNKWLEGREAGNKRAHQLRQERISEQRQAQHEAEVPAIRDAWTKKMDEYMEERDKIMAHIFDSFPELAK